MTEPTLRPYPEYEETGHDWLGKVPSHWNVRRIRFLLNEVDERSEDGKETLLSVSKYSGVTPRKKGADGSAKTRASSLIGYKKVKTDDLVVNIMLAWNGSLGAAREPGIVSPAYGVYRLGKQAHPRYFHYLLRSPLYKSRIRASSTGVVESRLRLYSDDLYDLTAVLPPLDEQRQIARYLDAQMRRTDRLLRAKQRLIALLEEQKQALIQRAVTRGLDPDAPTKPSDVDWLGDVPAHWEMSRIKNELRNLNHKRIPLSSSERGKMKSQRYDYYGASGVIDKVNDYLFDDDLILLAEDGANLVLRNLPLVIIARGKFWVNNHAHILKPQRGELKYWAYLLESISYVPWIKGAAQPKLTQDRLMGVPIPAPPVSEQRAIIEHIEESTSHLDETIKKSKSEMDLIREYRTRLIADVVTGKLDVRGAEVKADATAQPKKPAGDRAPIPFQRATVAAGITERLRHTEGFGRVQLQKALVVVERHLKLDLDIKARRDEFGPFDNNAMRSVHAQFERSKWFKPIELAGGWRYDSLPKLDVYKRYFDDYIGGQTTEFERLTRMFERMSTDQSEIVATLYMAWNDELIEGRQPSDNKLLDEVLNNWHPSKRRFPREQWQRALDWMRDPERGNLIPTGFGASTKHD